MLANGFNLKVDLFKAAYHGSSTDSSSNFLNVVDSKILVISVGKNNFYKLIILKRLASKNIKVYRID